MAWGTSCSNFSSLTASTVLHAEYGGASYLGKRTLPDAMRCLPHCVIK